MVERLDLAWGALPTDLQLLAKSFIVRARRQQMRYFLHSLDTPWQRFKSDDDLFHAGWASRAADEAITAATPPNPFLHPDLTFERGCILYFQWKAEQGWGGSMKDESLRVLGWLGEEVGSSTLIEAITRDQVREFRDCLLRLGKGAQGKKLPLRKRLAEEGAERLAYVTRERYWRFATEFLRWFASEMGIADQSDGLLFPGGKNEVSRTPEHFSDDEVRALLFETPLFAGYLSTARRMAPGSVRRRSGYWWSAVLMLFTGIRAGDCAQLLPKDFHLDDELPYFVIQPGKLPDGQPKTSKFGVRSHVVPVHPTLIALGLREFVASRGTRKPAVRLFFEIGLGGKQAERRNDEVLVSLPTQVRCSSAGRSTHVFRHTLANRLRATGLSREIGSILGHTTGNVTDGYGGPQPLKRKAEIIGKLDFGFDVLEALGGPYDPKIH